MSGIEAKYGTREDEALEAHLAEPVTRDRSERRELLRSALRTERLLERLIDEVVRLRQADEPQAKPATIRRAGGRR